MYVSCRVKCPTLVCVAVMEPVRNYDVESLSKRQDQVIIKTVLVQ